MAIGPKKSLANQKINPHTNFPNIYIYPNSLKTINTQHLKASRHLSKLVWGLGFNLFDSYFHIFLTMADTSLTGLAPFEMSRI